MTVSTDGWKHIGSTDNAEFYEVEPEILAVVPHERSVDDETTARQSIELQLEYLRRHDRRAGVIVFVDRVVDQDAGARSIYRTAPDPTRQVCFALVSEDRFGMAVASIFMKLSPPKSPTKMFEDVERAKAWIRSMVAKR